MSFNPSPTELTTAATDAAMGVLCLALMLRLQRMRVAAAWTRSVWRWVFGLLVVASVLGAIVHGLSMPATLRTMLWAPLYLALGLSVALFLVAAVADWKGEQPARPLLPWAVGLGIVFFAASQMLGGAFLVFVGYEAVAMLMALVIYICLATNRRHRGAALVSVGIALTLVAAAIQASTLRLNVGVPFDHNGLFHLVQMIAIIVLAGGIRKGLAKPADDRRLPTERA